ncbi:MAG TPA: hypothetical protein QGH10_00845 [Armatimonadota bacterium]|nr:hypothetical protein [Armatimonadota bacterium]
MTKQVSSTVVAVVIVVVILVVVVVGIFMFKGGEEGSEGEMEAGRQEAIQNYQSGTPNPGRGANSVAPEGSTPK